MHLTNHATVRWLKRLEAVECPDTTFLAPPHFPLVMKKAKGMHIVDVEGKRYLDFTACFAVAALGHGAASTRTALRKQSAHLIHGMGDVHPSQTKVQLLEALASIVPFVRPRILLGLSGSDAVEAALKTAMLATNRHKFLSLSGGYHGLQWGPLSLTHRSEFREGFEPWLQGKAAILPFPREKDFVHNDEASLEEVLNLLETHLKTKEYAAFILEPIQGRGGSRIVASAFLKRAKELCQRWGALIIFDEIFTGFGRTGSLFAGEQAGVHPDILCVGKALGGGLPLSACIGDVLEVWPRSQGEARHTQTFLGHPLACATALATLKEIQRRLPEFQKNLKCIDVVVNQWEKKHAGEVKVEGRGFMRGLAFPQRGAAFGVKLMEQLLKQGILSLPEGAQGDVLALTPPLIATQKDYKKLFCALDTILPSL